MGKLSRKYQLNKDMPLDAVKKAIEKMSPEECNVFTLKNCEAWDYRLIHAYGTGLDLEAALDTKDRCTLS